MHGRVLITSAAVLHGRGPSASSFSVERMQRPMVLSTFAETDHHIVNWMKSTMN